MREYCEDCGKKVKADVVVKREDYDIRGETIEVDAKVLVCPECGREFFSEELDEATIICVYNEYRRRHKLLYPEEIKQIREQYGLSQRSFAKLLNWGDKTIQRYENGSIQSNAHNSLLLFLRNPENMKAYLMDNKIALGEKQKTKLFSTIENLMQNKKYITEEKVIDILFAKEPCEENGYRAFDYEKFCAMVLYFSHRGPDLLKTKLMKLLYYSDMVFYKENGVSISGSRYVHLPYGPVPENFDIPLGMMSADNIAHIDVIYNNGYEKHQIVPEEDVMDGILTNDELDVLDRVYSKFANFGSVEISKYSHRERGYRETKKGDVISYSYAKDIEIN